VSAGQRLAIQAAALLVLEFAMIALVIWAMTIKI
jgi:hypothetical protein